MLLDGSLMKLSLKVYKKNNPREKKHFIPRDDNSKILRLYKEFLEYILN
jgi:hypothetical protein